MKKTDAIIIMDGFGYRKCEVGNAVSCVPTPFIDKLTEKYPAMLIEASGRAVGLPQGQMGNSEVGHLNLGAGRVVYQDITKIDKAIEDGDFFENEAFNGAIEQVKVTGGALHLVGLLSDGGVHSMNTHLYALLELAKRKAVQTVYVHCITDGRDVPPDSAIKFVAELEDKIKEIGVGKIATVVGRSYFKDRDNRWERVKKAYDMMTAGIGETTSNPEEYVRNSYLANVTDEFVIPASVVKNGKNVALIEEGDGIIFFNFRPDRARQITRAMSENDFDGFERKTGFINPIYVCFTRYDDSLTNVRIAFKPQSLKNTLGEYIASLGLKQLRIAETEKYAHVTFFFNGGEETPNENEDRVLIPSPKVATYDLKPEMSAYEVTEKVIEKLDEGVYDVVILNFANCDMVGHTGMFDATVKTVKTVDECVGKVIDKILSIGGNAIVTADHGNADKMCDECGKPFTAHTTNLVPFIVVGKNFEGRELYNDGKLCDVAPTFLSMMNLSIPEEMTGKSLLK